MTIIENIINNKLLEAKESLISLLTVKIKQQLTEYKHELADNMLCERSASNVIRQGRIIKVRRRIRRNSSGRIIVQRNIKKSALQGFRVSGSKIQRIPSMERIRRSRLLKQSWRTSRRAQLRRTLMKRKISMQRRLSMGI